jgi:hypothetical protein
MRTDTAMMRSFETILYYRITVLRDDGFGKHALEQKADFYGFTDAFSANSKYSDMLLRDALKR